MARAMPQLLVLPRPQQVRPLALVRPQQVQVVQGEDGRRGQHALEALQEALQQAPEATQQLQPMVLEG